MQCFRTFVACLFSCFWPIQALRKGKAGHLLRDASAKKHWYNIQAVAQIQSNRTFLSHDMQSSIDLRTDAGPSQNWRITLVSGDIYIIEAARVTDTGRTFLSHNGYENVDLWSGAGENQEWRITRGSNGGYIIQAATNLGERTYLSHDGDRNVDLWSGAGTNQEWFIPGFDLSPSKTLQQPISPSVCADPFVWDDGSQYHMICSHDRLPHYVGNDITSPFVSAGYVLPEGNAPFWSPAGERERWAPEGIQVGTDNYVFFSSFNYSEGRTQRLGWARADGSTGGDGEWDDFADQQWFDEFPKSPGGDIDAHVYQEVDESGTTRYYLLWKSDDNNAGDLVTRLWMQEVVFRNKRPRVQGAAQVLLDSTDLWWVGSWEAGGGLIEGPEIVKEGGYYYLFFASGRFCKSDYAEGVARSQNLWGPYEKNPEPLVTTGTVGHVEYNGEQRKIVGPGHAGFFKQSGIWYMVWHGSLGHFCNRHAFVSPMRFEGGWPQLA